MNLDNMIQGNPQALVTSYNGVLVADSLVVADQFGKPHKNVLIVIYKSDDRLKLEKEVIRAKKSGFPYAIIVPRDANTTV